MAATATKEKAVPAAPAAVDEAPAGKGCIVKLRDGTEFHTSSSFTTTVKYLRRATEAPVIDEKGKLDTERSESLTFEPYDPEQGKGGRLFVGHAEAAHAVVLEVK
jgi:hypothetical protein